MPQSVHTPDALPPATRVGGLEFDSVLGSSGFSVTYLATDRALGRLAAVEEYLPATLVARSPSDTTVLLRNPAQQAAFDRGLDAFIAEADLLAQCHHPSLPRMLLHWRANGTAYREMPFVQATSLRALRSQMVEPPDEDALRALIDGLLGALDILHAAGRVHGAVSPDSVVLRADDDSPLLLGFDAAERAIVGDQAQALMRAVSSIPGQGDGQPLQPWMDIYAIAALVRFCIDGVAERIAPADSVALIAARVSAQFPVVRYSTPFVEAMDWALASQPHDRPISVAQFRAVLTRRGRRGTTWSPVPGQAAAGPVSAALAQAFPFDAPPPAAQDASTVVMPRAYLPPDLQLGAQPPLYPPSDATVPMMASSFPPRAAAPEPPPNWPDRPSAPEEDHLSAEVLAALSRTLPPRRPMPQAASPVMAAKPPVAPPHEEIGLVMPGAEAWDDERLSPPASRWRRIGIGGGIVVLLFGIAAAGWQLQQQWRSNTDQREMARITDGSLPTTLHASAPTDPLAGLREPAAEPSRPAAVAEPSAPAASRSDAEIAALLNAAPPASGGVAAPPVSTPSPATVPQASVPATTAVTPTAPSNTQPLTAREGTLRQATPFREEGGREPADPRAACAPRTEFALYRCMQTQCARRQWSQHPQCVRLREDDSVE